MNVVARRAMVRWAWRMFRREWHQHVLVLGLLTVSVAGSIGLASAAYNITGVSEDAVFGSADHLYRAEAPVPRSLPGLVEAARAEFADVDVFVQWSRPVPGSVEAVEFKAQDPAGPFSAPMLALRDGRYPGRADEIAVTDGVAETFGLGLGQRFDLDGRDRTVVGLVENPSDLGSEFALASPSDRDLAEEVTILVGGTGGSEQAQALQDFGAEKLGGDAEITSRSDANEEVVVAAIVLGTDMVALLLVSLVATAGFAALAQRRSRQLGMLGAIGATEDHLRLVVVASGAVIGVVAAVIGAALGVATWIAAASRMEEAVGHRIDPLHMPWWVVAAAMALATIAATAAAWWPARAVARLPVTSALSGRPPRPQPVHHSATLAGLLVAVGVVCLTLAERSNAGLLAAGAVATVAGVLLASPLAIRLVAGGVRRLPFAVRLPLRDLGRHQARSGAALAAISLTLGIPVAIVVAATAAESAAARSGNLSDRQLLVWTRDPDQPEGVSPYYTEDPADEGFSPYLPRLTPAELEDMAGQVDHMATTFDDATVTALELATDPSSDPTPDGRLAVTLARPADNGYFDVAPLFLATPELLDHYGLEPDALGPAVDVLSVPTGERLPSEARRMLVSDDLYFSNTSEHPELAGTVEQLTPGYSSLPGSFITPEGLHQRGWRSTPVGWLVETASPLTSDQLLDARELAADAGMLIEARQREASLASLRWGATASGTLLALGVLAMTVGLIRTTAAADLRTLTATGATSGIRRALTAATAGGLALLGAVLGTVGAYAALVASYLGDISRLVPAPVLHLVVIAVGIPVLAALAGWLLAGREPRALARQAME
jgi:putative ABC transport system permease protein